MAGKALEGVRVLEYCSMVSGPYCTKLMADLGADVIKIEPPRTGDEARRRAPFPDDIPHSEKSGLFLFLNTNKRGVTLNPEKPDGKKIFEALVKEVDILVDATPLGEMEKLGLAYNHLKKLNPGLIMISITPYGRSGPFKNYKAYPLNTAHASGQANMLPTPSPNLERPPVKVGGHSSRYDPGVIAAVAILSALYRQRITGKGQFIELSRQEALNSIQRVESVTYANDNVYLTREGPKKGRLSTMMLPCKDGYVVAVIPLDHQWEALKKLMGSPDWAEKDWCRDFETRNENAEELKKLIIEWMMKHTKEEICKKGQALSCPISPINSAEDVVNSEQYQTRGFFTEITHPKIGKIKLPTAPYHFSKSPWSIERPSPLLGEHNEEIFCKRLGYTKAELLRLKTDGVV